MQDCRLILEVRNDKVLFQAEHIDMVELATMCGILQQLVGLEAYRRGKSLDDIKDNMLDIHLASMEALVEQIMLSDKNKFGQRAGWKGVGDEE